MSNAAAIEHASTPGARKLTWILAISSLLIPAVFYLPALAPARAPVSLILIPLLLYALALAIPTVRVSPHPLPLPAFLAGALFVIGGTAFDLYATIVHTPDLAREGNPVARTLLDAGYPLHTVIAFGIVAQVLMTAFLVTLWAGVLKHRPVLLASAERSNSKNVFEFIKAGVGAADLTWRQAFFPFTYSELPRAYHFIWYIATVFVVMWAYRWSLGLAWFGHLSWPATKIVALTAAALGITLHSLWLAASYKRSEHA